MTIRFDELRAVEILGIIDLAWKNKTGIFQNVVLPQDRWDLPDSQIELALFLFYAAIFMRGGIISEDPFRILFQLREDNPELFNPEFVAKKLLPQTVEEAIKGVKIFSFDKGGSILKPSNAYKLEEHSRSWYHNSLVLMKRFGGNPLRIFEATDDFEEAFSRIDRNRKENKEWGIIGMRRKIFSLFAIWLQEKKLVPHYPTPIPVDFHAMRVLWATGIVEFKKLMTLESSMRYPPSLFGKEAIRITEGVMDKIAIWTMDFLSREKISHLHINPALWTLSRDFCSRSYPNSSTTSEGKITLREPELLENPHVWPPKYKNPCLFCPVEEYCHGAIPAAPYYKWGILLKMPRSQHKPLQPLLPHIYPREIMGKVNGRTRR